MFKIIEVDGSSAKGFSAAVKDSIDRLTAAGEKVSYFQVIEQRGAFREEQVEFQVKLKVAVVPIEEKVASAL